MIPALLLPLIAQGMTLLGNAALVKGKDWLKDKTGVDLGNMAPGDIDKLKEYEEANHQELLNIQLEKDKLTGELKEMYLKDVQSARTLQQIALQQSDTWSRRFLYYFALFWAFAAVIYIGAITFIIIPEENQRFADTILGFILGTVIAQIIAFFFGSSQSSKDKDATVTEAVNVIRDKQEGKRMVDELF